MNTVDSGFPTIIDSIIEQIDHHTCMYVQEWEQVDDEICVVLYGGYLGSDVLDVITKDIRYRFVIKVCNTWMDLVGDKRLIYRGGNHAKPKNSRWMAINNVEVRLFFKYSDVGVPQLRRPNMRKVNVCSSNLSG